MTAASTPGKKPPSRRRIRHGHERQKELATKLMAEDPSLSKDHAMSKAQKLMRDDEKDH